MNKIRSMVENVLKNATECSLEYEVMGTLVKELCEVHNLKDSDVEDAIFAARIEWDI